MPSLTAEGFIISLSLGQNDVRVVKGALCLLREHFIHRSRNADSAGDDLGNAVESRVLRVLNGRVTVLPLASPWAYFRWRSVSVTGFSNGNNCTKNG